jgi:hypothetical protein
LAAIAALLYRYARAVDTKDWELYRSVLTDDAHIDYSSAGAAVGSRDEVVDWFTANFGVIHGACTTSPTSRATSTGTPRRYGRLFYNPMQLPGMAETSSCGGYYHHELVRTPDGWRSRRLREETVWFVSAPAGAPDVHM